MKNTPFRNHRGFWAFALLALTGVASCGGDDAHPEGKGSGAVCPPGSTLTYENFGRTFMQTYCTRCHASALMGDARKGAPADHNFDTLSQIRFFADHIDGRAAAGPSSVTTSMPPDDTKPSEENRRKLGEWLACETGSDEDSGTPGDGGGRGDTGTPGDGGRG